MDALPTENTKLLVPKKTLLAMIKVLNVEEFPPEMACIPLNTLLLTVVLLELMERIRLVDIPANTLPSIVQFVEVAEHIIPKGPPGCNILHLLTVNPLLLHVRLSKVIPINWQDIALMLIVVKAETNGPCLTGLCPVPMTTIPVLKMVIAP